MKAVVPAAAPDGGAAAEAQVLIEEARAHARRRRRRTALVVVCVAALATGVLAAVPGLPGSRPVARGDGTGPSAVMPALAVPPRFFVDTEVFNEGSGPLQIRESATGKLVGEVRNPPGVMLPLPGVADAAATGLRSFVVALPVGMTCATRLYRLRLNQQGRASALSPVGPTLPGMLWSLASSTDGKVIGYAISGCSKGDRGSLGVLDVHGGQMRQWTDIGVAGVSVGDLVLNGPLSMSADGRLLAFAADFISHAPYGRITAEEVRELPTDAPGGTVAARSHLVVRHAGTAPKLAAATLSPGGTSFYVCSQSVTRTKATARIVAYRTATRKPYEVIATFTAKGTWPQVSCSSMAIDPSGQFLLVPYWLHYSNPRNPYAGYALLQVARIDIATGARSTWTASLPDDSGTARPGGMNIAW